MLKVGMALYLDGITGDILIEYGNVVAGWMLWIRHIHKEYGRSLNEFIIKLMNQFIIKLTDKNAGNEQRDFWSEGVCGLDLCNENYS